MVSTIKIFLCLSWMLLSIHTNITPRFANGLAASPRGGRRGSTSAAPSPPRNRNRNRIDESLPAQRIRAAPERTVVILYHKPPGVITSHESQDSRPTVYEEVQSMTGFLSTTSDQSLSFETATGIRSKLHAIGRLDADTTGLLLLTNDGRLLHHVTNPDANTEDQERCSSRQEETTKIYKTYEAWIMGHHTEDSLEAIREGVQIGKNCVTQPLSKRDDLRILDHPNHKSTIVSITIGEGKNRQVRKMFHAIGSGVMKLKRTRIGEDLTLDGVEEGQWRLLTDDEVRRCLNWKPREIVPVVSASPRSQRRRPKQRRRRNS